MIILNFFWHQGHGLRHLARLYQERTRGGIHTGVLGLGGRRVRHNSLGNIGKSQKICATLCDNLDDNF